MLRPKGRTTGRAVPRVSDPLVRLRAGHLVNDSDVAFVCHTSVHDVTAWRSGADASAAEAEQRLFELCEVVWNSYDE